MKWIILYAKWGAPAGMLLSLMWVAGGTLRRSSDGKWRRWGRDV